MNEQLKNKIETFFTEVPATTAVQEFKEEVLADANEAFVDYQNSHTDVSDEETIEAVLSGMGDIAEIAKMIAGDSTELTVTSTEAGEYDLLAVNIYAGQVYLSGGTGTEFKVNQITSIKDPEFEVQINKKNRTFEVTMPRPTGRGILNFFKANFKTHFKNVIKIEVPESYLGKVDIKLNAGEAFVSDLTIDDDLMTSISAGDLHVENVQAGAIFTDISAGRAQFKNALSTTEFKATVSAGDLTLKHVTAKFDIEAAAGNVKAKHVTGSGRFKANAGNIDADWENVRGDIELETAVGNINMQFATQMNFGIQGDSTMGSIKVLREHTVMASTGQLNATVGINPEFKVYANTSLGSIVIK